MSNAVYIERYRQLIRVMKDLTPHERKKHFDMEQWGQATECGTTMCAAGFCGIDPWFRKNGFRFDFKLHEEDYEGNQSPYGEITYRGKESWQALRAFFGPQVIADSLDEDPVFESPTTVNEVIKAAEETIKLLKKRPRK